MKSRGRRPKIALASRSRLQCTQIAGHVATCRKKNRLGLTCVETGVPLADEGRTRAGDGEQCEVGTQVSDQQCRRMGVVCRISMNPLAAGWNADAVTSRAGWWGMVCRGAGEGRSGGGRCQTGKGQFGLFPRHADSLAPSSASRPSILFPSPRFLALPPHPTIHEGGTRILGCETSMPGENHPHPGTLPSLPVPIYLQEGISRPACTPGSIVPAISQALRLPRSFGPRGYAHVQAAENGRVPLAPIPSRPPAAKSSGRRLPSPPPLLGFLFPSRNCLSVPHAERPGSSIVRQVAGCLGDTMFSYAKRHERDPRCATKLNPCRTPAAFAPFPSLPPTFPQRSGHSGLEGTGQMGFAIWAWTPDGGPLPGLTLTSLQGRGLPIHISKRFEWGPNGLLVTSPAPSSCLFFVSSKCSSGALELRLPRGKS